MREEERSKCRRNSLLRKRKQVIANLKKRRVTKRTIWTKKCKVYEDS